MFFILISSANPCGLRGGNIGLCSPCINGSSLFGSGYAGLGLDV